MTDCFLLCRLFGPAPAALGCLFLMKKGVRVTDILGCSIWRRTLRDPSTEQQSGARSVKICKSQHAQPHAVRCLLPPVELKQDNSDLQVLPMRKKTHVKKQR
jgi:hypothetical protein